jgi:outer membrane lipoprotein-sorting protein
VVTAHPAHTFRSTVEHWSEKSVALALLFLMSVSLGCGKRGSQPDPCAIVKSISATYCGLGAYQIIAVRHMTAGNSRKETTLRLVAARGANGCFRREMAYLPAAPTIDVSDGRQEWIFFPEKKQFALRSPEAGPAATSMADVTESLCATGDAPVRHVEWLRTETVSLEGQPLMCDVITVSPGKTYWVERLQHRVLREEEVFSDGSRWETDYVLVHLNQEPPAELFRSPVTADAKRIEMPTSRGISLAATWEDRYRKATKDLEGAHDDLDRFVAVGSVAKAAFEVGRIEEARRRAQQALDLAPRFRRNWNYGNAIHDGHMVLGRVALRNGDLATAKRELIAAGKTPGSPQLDTVGPNMSLAKELLDRNQRQAVGAYFSLCELFWERRETLRAWAAIAERGEVPDFGPSLRY